MEKENINSIMESLIALGQEQEKYEKQYESEVNEFWNNLPYDDKLKAFYAVVSRIYDGEIKKQGSYRYILYDIFGFGPEAYGIGMQCGFMTLHNSIDVKNTSV